MEEIKAEALLLLAAFAMGAATGLAYDLLRPFRNGKSGGILPDAVFCSVCAGGLFTFAMKSSSATLGIWELAAALIGFISYIFSLSSLILPFFYKCAGAFDSISELKKKYIKKIKLSRKNLFKKTQK